LIQNFEYAHPNRALAPGPWDLDFSLAWSACSCLVGRVNARGRQAGRAGPTISGVGAARRSGVAQCRVAQVAGGLSVGSPGQAGPGDHFATCSPDAGKRKC